MRNKKPLIFVLLLMVVGIVGGTLAYYSSTDTFNNEFNTGTYGIQAQEVFQSPDDWVPGTTTDKTVVVTNQGNTPAAVRVRLTPSWKDENGDPLGLTDGTNEAAIINYSFDKDYKWVKEGDWYYYIRPIDTNESTSSLIESVTFNPNVNVSSTKNCVEDQNTHSITCTTETTGFGGGTYTLNVDIQTCQYDKYQEVWGTNVTISNPEKKTGTLVAVNKNDSVHIYGKTLAQGYKSYIETVNFLDVINIPNNAIETWDCSSEQNGSVMCWYTDIDSNGKYELFIGQEGGVVANSNSEGAISFFSGAKEINVNHLNTSNVTSMEGMFYNTGYPSNVQDSFVIKGLEHFDTSKVTNMKEMFRYTGRAYYHWSIGDISGWDTSKVTDMSYMFERSGYLAQKFDINIGTWDVSSVTTMQEMFSSAGLYADYFNIGNLTNWNTQSVTNMSRILDNAAYNAQVWNDIGTLKVYADNISYMICSVKNAKAVFNIYNNPSYYDSAFRGTSTIEGSSITVNYKSNVVDIDNIVATKSDTNSNVIKGSLIN